MLHEASAHLDRAQVRGVRRQELHRRAGGLDQGHGLGVLVDREVFEQHDVAGVQDEADPLWWTVVGYAARLIYCVPLSQVDTRRGDNPCVTPGVGRSESSEAEA